MLGSVWYTPMDTTDIELFKHAGESAVFFYRLLCDAYSQLLAPAALSSAELGKGQVYVHDRVVATPL